MPVNMSMREDARDMTCVGFFSALSLVSGLEFTKLSCFRSTQIHFEFLMPWECAQDRHSEKLTFREIRARRA